MPDGGAARVLEALGDSNRRRIVELLRDEARAVGAIAAEMDISRPAVSRHLRLLEAAHLVSHREEGTRSIYFLSDAGAADARAYLENMWGESIARYRLVADNLPPRAGDPRD